MKNKLFLFLFLFIIEAVTLYAQIEQVIIKTKAENNLEALFYYRVPLHYSKSSGQRYRVLVIFGGRNTTGASEARGKLGFGKWADENDVFIVAPGFYNDKYWTPAKWSGKALIKALNKIGKKYKICKDKILYYGYSAGSQAANLFPEWRPSICRAWVSHACGVFHEPSFRMRDIPGLVTCGDADTARYIISRRFVMQSRKKGISIIWKSMPNRNHDVPVPSLVLAKAFLSYYHKLHQNDLMEYDYREIEPSKQTFVGDDQEGKYYLSTSNKAKNVFPEDRVYLPSKEIAEAWGVFDK